MRAPREPFRAKIVEPIALTTAAERRDALDSAGWNPFQIPARQVELDLLTDSGTGAMSQRQWAALMMGDESYAGSRSFERFRDAVEEVMGFPLVVPAHQGRGAEGVFFGAIIDPGEIVPSNGHFDTTRAHIEIRGGIALDLPSPESLDPALEAPFKGNVDLARLEELLAGPDGERVSIVMLTLTNNTAGGQPVSLANIRATAALARAAGNKLFLDAARFAENAWFIREREAGYAETPLGTIVREMLADADAVLMSGKKDAIANIGGFAAVRDDEEFFARLQARGVVSEGFPTYGGLAGRDLEALAVGLREVLEPEYLDHRIQQVAFLASVLEEAGGSILRPVGGHAVYLDAGVMLPHVPPERFPGWALSCALYLAGAVRVVEIGSVMAGRDPETGKNRHPPLELVRLAVPRRVYSSRQLEHAGDALAAALGERDAIQGVEMLSEAPVLRHFTARFRPVGAHADGGRDLEPRGSAVL
ncbi:MAG: tryptophanase [Actinobacteria bacterium]|nr:tryptophanase [Actinomycetota bacterium]